MYIDTLASASNLYECLVWSSIGTPSQQLALHMNDQAVGTPDRTRTVPTEEPLMQRQGSAGRETTPRGALVQDDVRNPARLVGLQLRVQLLVHHRRRRGGNVRPQAPQDRVQPVDALEVGKVDPRREVLALQDLRSRSQILDGAGYNANYWQQSVMSAILEMCFQSDGLGSTVQFTSKEMNVGVSRNVSFCCRLSWWNGREAISSNHEQSHAECAQKTKIFQVIQTILGLKV